MIQVTQKAKERILALRAEENKDDSWNLRVGVIGGGCSGLSYDLKFDNTSENGDTIVDLYEVKVMIDKKSLLYLIGTVLDYNDGLNGKGFVFNNPAATRVCGCGESFSV
jgi:iron-sulfur cluster assembly protein